MQPSIENCIHYNPKCYLFFLSLANITSFSGMIPHFMSKNKVYQKFAEKIKEKTFAHFCIIVRQIWLFFEVQGGGTTLRFVSVRQNMSKCYFAQFPNFERKSEVFILFVWLDLQRISFLKSYCGQSCTQCTIAFPTNSLPLPLGSSVGFIH